MDEHSISQTLNIQCFITLDCWMSCTVHGRCVHWYWNIVKQCSCMNNNIKVWCDSTYQYVLVYTSMYWYLLVCTWMNKVFLKHWIFSVLSLWTTGCHVLCMGDVCIETETLWNTAPVWTIISMSDVTVHTSMYWYILVCTDFY